MILDQIVLKQNYAVEKHQNFSQISEKNEINVIFVMSLSLYMCICLILMFN